MEANTRSLGLISVAEDLRRATAGFDPALLSGGDAARVVEVTAATEKACALVRARCAARVEECGAHRRDGFTRASDWMAAKTGVDPGRARREIETAKAAEDMPQTKAALDKGEVSLDEAAEITSAPEAEQELLDLAKHHDHRRLKDRARRRRLEAKGDDLGSRRKAARFLRTWVDDLGMRRGSFSLLPEVGETFERRLRAEMERMWKSGSREGTSEQRAHDAFVAMLEGKGRPGRRPDFVAVYDVRAHSTHIPGVGPLDDETTRAAARDAIVWAVLHDGQKVSDIIRFGDYIPRPLEVLLEIGDPPHFEGVRCADCGATFAFERDHVDPRANGGPTSNVNLEPRCPPCHRAKTERDREAGLLGKNPPRRRPGGGRSRPKRASAARGVGTSRAGP